MDRVAELQEIIGSWRDWHRELVNAMDLPFVERGATLKAVKRAETALKSVVEMRDEDGTHVILSVTDRDAYDDWEEGRS